MKKVFLSLLIVIALSFNTKRFAENDIFIKAIGSTGEGSTVGVFDGGSTDDMHPKEISVFAYTDGLAGCATALKSGGGAAAVCKVAKTPFSFSTSLSPAIVSFKYNLVKWKVLNSVDMVMRKAGREAMEYYKRD